MLELFLEKGFGNFKFAKSGIVWLDVERSGNGMLLERFDF
jgi:hypothetical protein